MENQDLQTLEQEDISLTSEQLDQFVSTDDDTPGSDEDNLVSSEPDVDVIKEEPVLSSLDDSEDLGTLDELDTVGSDIDELESVAEELPTAGLDESSDSGSSSGEVLYSDESAALSSDESALKDEKIVVDEEAEKIVKDEISKTDVTDEEQISVEEIESPVDATPEEDSSQAESSFFSDDDDETISLSSDELSNILEDTDETPSEAGVEEVPTVDSVLEQKTDEVSEPVLEESSEETEEVLDTDEASLDDLSSDTVSDLSSESDTGETIEELEVGDDVPSMDPEDVLVEDDIKVDQVDEPVDLPVVEETDDQQTERIEKEAAELDELEESEESTAIDSDDDVLEPLDEGSINVDEIEALDAEPEIEETIPVETVQTDESAPVSTETTPEESIDDASSESTSFFEDDEDESISLTTNELDTILQDTDIAETKTLEDASPKTEASQEVEELSPLETASEEEINVEDVDAAAVSAPSSPASIKGDIDKDQLKTVLKYLDGLLDDLPEDKIKEFAESEYYDLYNKLLDSLGV